MEDRRSDTEETFGSQSPPAAVSNQNQEEGEAGAGDPSRERSEDDQDPGGAKEGTQSTGHPENAG